ncbi:hypothetical protein Ade02nite_00180 [Paractinoplanes deccanensis]|uniref:Uncharacterized protein n=1 Tax=Paractinoplanes deccanensis TaxID=113561 RepID=A0ABQ3XUQ8_9ACTN|nr:hypothetical protein [Actinoplanes deccanensis]GID71377.1 hypothetical protein Ade02nite_00180 [Actinoplanes deccanensis]
MWVTGGHYQAWATFLERWGAGENLDPATLPALTKDDFAGDSWQRLADRITGALSARLTVWSDTLARELSAARDEFAAARALNHARWSLPPVRALAAAPGIPEELRGRLIGLVDGHIEATQRQIDEQIQRLRSAGVPRAAVEARLRTVRDNPLTAVTRAPHVTGGGWDRDPAATPRRRVILD